MALGNGPASDDYAEASASARDVPASRPGVPRRLAHCQRLWPSGMDVDPVPGQFRGVGFQRDGAPGVPIPPGILVVALQSVPHFDNGEHAAHRDIVPERAHGPFHRNTIRRHRHDLRHPAHVHARVGLSGRVAASPPALYVFRRGFRAWHPEHGPARMGGALSGPLCPDQASAGRPPL
jgi:hypothetical protein